jgi:LPXTG-motif cell wall-anchored protein
MLNVLARAGLATAVATALAPGALADVKPPEATDPGEPIGMLTVAAIVLAAGALGYFLYRRRQR